MLRADQSMTYSIDSVGVEEDPRDDGITRREERHVMEERS